MAEVITNQDLDENKPKTPGQQNSVVQNTQNKADGNSQIAQNYGGQGANKAPTQPAAQPYNPNQQRGSGYTNIQRIVGANQANKLGQTIGGGIQQAGQQTRANIQQAGQQFQNQSNANRFDTAENSQLIGDVLNDPTKYAQMGQNDPNSQAGTQFNRLLSGNYQGPAGLQNAQQLQAQAQDVNQLGQSIGSQGGRQGLLQRFVGAPQYNAGQQKLDALLLGQTGQGDLAAARRSAMGLQNQATSQIGGAAATAQEYANRAREFGQGAQGQLGENLTAQDTALQAKATETQAQRDADLKAVQDALTSGNLNKDVASQLGIDKGQMTYNIDPTKFLQGSSMQASEQNVASGQDYARMNALRQLSGSYGPEAAQNILQKFAGQDKQSGTLDKAYNLDKEGYQKAVQGAKTDYDAKLGDATNRTGGAIALRDRISALAEQRRNAPTKGAQNDADEAIRKFVLESGLNQRDSLQRMHEWSIGDNLAKAQANEAAVRQMLQQQYGNKTFNVDDGTQQS